MAELAKTCYALGRYDKAFHLHQAALDLRSRVLGDNHPDTRQSVAYLASAQEALQQLHSAVQAVRSSTVARSEKEYKLQHRSLRKGMHGKIGRFYNLRPHKSRRPN
jgi:hypothetical protein